LSYSLIAKGLHIKKNRPRPCKNARLL
jgi:hypothetical protein